MFGETQSKRLQKLQNRAARIILNISKDIDHSIALHALGRQPGADLGFFIRKSNTEGVRHPRGGSRNFEI